ncbi:SDR family NAD(P)-dependent oxidoreductase, partial [Nanoarchaeota archaeon]
MRYLVTGGAGFIGSHVCEQLLAEGAEVVCVDNFNEYYDPKLKERNIKGFQNNKNFTLVKADIRDKLDKAFKGVDVVIHLAARAGVRSSLIKPSLYFDVNVNGTGNLLQLAIKHGAKRFINGSSSSTYGVSKDMPFKEDGECLPISPYAASKITAEYLCRAYYEKYKLPTANLRFFTVYGPRNRPDMAVHLFTERIMKGEPIDMYGDGSSQRDYTYVLDIAQGVINSAKNHKGYEIYNIGNNTSVELKRLISAIEKAVG